ncbi:MAG: type 4a pilus biogenesis protein PilO [Desulfobacteraceae bacterium]|nr:type 4a pilus biogenesis protein PilO [Desulfobacteraceae bacterium]
MKIIFSFSEFKEKLTALPPAQKVALFFFTFALIGGAFYLLVYQDQIDTIARLTKNISEQERKLAKLKEAQAKVGMLEKELEKSEQELARLVSFLPDQKEIPGLLENVSMLGAKVGLENILFQPQPEVQQEFYAVIPIRLDLLGSFNDLGVFLDNISKLNRILKVESLTVTRQKDKQIPLLQVACTIVTYRFIDKPPEPPAGQKPGQKPAPPKK